MYAGVNSMRMSALLLLLLPLLFCASAAVAGADLQSYVRSPEPAYKWALNSVTQAPGGGAIYDLSMTSLTWHGITWHHHLQVFVPARLTHPHFCALLNTGGSGSFAETELGMGAANASGSLFAILFNIPNQPLFGGKSEDALVVYTWVQFLETGDETWPLHWPMAKAVIKAMDTVQALAKKEKMAPVDSFLVTGASKRGWTTWLAAASGDSRIKAIAPMVIDTLNVAAQAPHQLAAYGKFSEQIDDYTKANIPARLQTPRGQELLRLEDPYSYRDRLTLPKLIILGTNDRYWAQDALNLYWGGLKGPKWVLYDPNSGHGLEDRTRVYATLSEFIRLIASGNLLPAMKWAYDVTPAGVQLSVTSSPSAVSARLYRCYSSTQDFRDSRWTSEPMALKSGAWQGELNAPATGYAATFGELTFQDGENSYTLSTQIHILVKH